MPEKHVTCIACGELANWVDTVPCPDCGADPLCTLCEEHACPKEPGDAN